MKSTHKQNVINEAVKKNTTITLLDFFNMLEKHDWYSSFSDSSAVYKQGQNDFEWLQYIASTNHRFDGLLATYRDLVNSKKEIDVDILVGEDKLLETTYENITRGENGILLRGHDEYGYSNEVWDKTDTDEGHFSVNEIDGRHVGVFPSWEIALQVAAYATGVPDGGYGDVVIENVSVFNSFDEWFD